MKNRPTTLVVNPSSICCFVQKVLLLLAPLFCVVLDSNSQIPNWLWVQTAGASGNDGGKSIARDSYDNIILVGVSSSPSISFGTTNLIGAGIFVVKYNPAGNVLWATHIPGSGSSTGSNFVSVDANDNIYITGSFYSTITVGTTTLTSAGSNDLFIAKYNSAGSPQWAVSGGGAGIENPRGIATDGGGNVYLIAEFTSVVTSFGGTNTFTNSNTNNSSDVVLVKYSSTGSFLWGATASNPDYDFAASLATDMSGNVFITGTFSSSISFGSNTFTSAGSTDFFVAKYNTAGALQWATASGGTGADMGWAVTTDAMGSIYLLGDLGSSTSITLGLTSLSSFAFSRSFLVKYSASGSILWACGVGMPSDHTHAGSVSLDQIGNIYVSGSFYGASISIGQNVLTNLSPGTNPYPSDVYIAKYSISGTPLWAKAAGGTLGNFASGTVVDGAGSLYVTGAYYGIDMSFDAITITNAASPDGDIYLGKIGPGCSAPPGQPSNISGSNAPCVGGSETYYVTPDPDAGSYNWVLPLGWTGTSNTNSIVITPGTTGGNIEVVAMNTCGVSNASGKAVSVSPLPAPTVTKSGNTLMTQAGQGAYQWFKNSTSIPGETSNTYVATTSGIYYVVVTDINTCEGTSNAVGVTVGVNDVTQHGAELYLDARRGKMVIESGAIHGTGQYILVNSLGQILGRGQVGPKNTEVDLSYLATGFYTIAIQFPGCRLSHSFIK